MTDSPHEGAGANESRGMKRGRRKSSFFKKGCCEQEQTAGQAPGTAGFSPMLVRTPLAWRLLRAAPGRPSLGRACTLLHPQARGGAMPCQLPPEPSGDLQTPRLLGGPRTSGFHGDNRARSQGENLR